MPITWSSITPRHALNRTSCCTTSTDPSHCGPRTGTESQKSAVSESRDMRPAFAYLHLCCSVIVALPGWAVDSGNQNEMIRIPAGEFYMGAGSASGGLADEQPERS